MQFALKFWSVATILIIIITISIGFYFGYGVLGLDRPVPYFIDRDKLAQINSIGVIAALVIGPLAFIGGVILLGYIVAKELKHE